MNRARRLLTRRHALAALGGLILLLAPLAGCGSSDNARQGPADFFGIAPAGPLNSTDFDRMQTGEVGQYHVLLSWAQVETEKDTYDWTRFDDLYENLAMHGIDPVTVVIGTPAHYAPEPTYAPTVSDEALKGWKHFLEAAAERYGPDGDFWRQFVNREPDVEPRPIETWEIWNEPNAIGFWQPKPDPAAYGKLLTTSADAIHSVQPEAEIMTGGMFATPLAGESISSFDFLRQLYEQPDVADAIDVVAVHPYGPEVSDVEKQMEMTHEVITEAGDDAGMWVTEVGWGSDPSIKSGQGESPDGQAEKLTDTFQMLLDNREEWGLHGVLWYTWVDFAAPDSACLWCPTAGLLDSDRDPKPAYDSFVEFTGGEGD